MQFDYGVPKPKASDRTKYNFDQVKPGASVHVLTDSERCRMMMAFRYWATKTKKIGAYATSSKVGDDDPRGPGFRIWFRSKRADPAAAPIDMPAQDVPVARRSDDI